MNRRMAFVGSHSSFINRVKLDFMFLESVCSLIICTFYHVCQYFDNSNIKFSLNVYLGVLPIMLKLSVNWSVGGITRHVKVLVQ